MTLIVQASLSYIAAMSVLVRHQTWLAVIFSTIILAAYSLYIQPWMIDDAFIAFRYAENIIAGNGPVFNAGEKVEGYTSFMWVVLMAFGRWFGADTVVFSKILGLVFASGTVILLASAHGLIRTIDVRVSAVATLLLGTTGVFLPWGVSGMETTLFAFMVTLSVLYYLSTGDSNDGHKLIRLGLLCGLMSLIRPEGLLVTAVIILHRSLKNIKDGNYSFIYIAVFFLVVYLPYFFWRYGYYGFLFPNSFYAKVGWDASQVIRGFRYLVKFGIPSLTILLPIIDPIGISGWFKKYRKLAILPLTAAVYTIYIILVGGDPMPALRFFTPIMPIFCLISAMTITLIENKKLMTLVVTIAIAYNIAQLNFLYITPLIKFDKTVEYGREVGRWFEDNVPADAVIATNTAGSIPYYSRVRVVDMLGLTDLHIAHSEVSDMGSGWAGHEKADGEYVLSRKPDYILFFSSLGSAEPVFPSDKEIYAVPEFHELYELKQIVLPSGKKLTLYVRKPSQDGPGG